MSETKSLPRVSLVIPVFNESQMIAPLFQRLAPVVRGLARYEWELILVDDGSHDDSVPRILVEAPLFPGRVVVRKFSRNFGHQAALMAGLEKASGEAVIIIDADLQDPPELFPAFLQHFEEGADVVYGVRAKRKTAWYKNIAYKIFYQMFQRMADIPIPLDVGDFGLISRRAANIIRQMPEQDLLLRGLRSWVGFRQVGVPYDRPDRHAGETKYTLRKLVRLAGSAFFGYSLLPLRIATNCGLGAVLLGLLYGCYALYGKLVFDANPPGWTSLTLVVLILGGAQLIRWVSSANTSGAFTSKRYIGPSMSWRKTSWSEPIGERDFDPQLVLDFCLRGAGLAPGRDRPAGLLGR